VATGPSGDASGAGASVAGGVLGQQGESEKEGVRHAAEVLSNFSTE